MKALPVKECKQGNGVNIRNNKMQEMLKVGVIPSILYMLYLGLRLVLKDVNNYAIYIPV